MTRVRLLPHTLFQLAATLLTLLGDGLCYLGLCLRPAPALAAENPFLRRQLALYPERHVNPPSSWSGSGAVQVVPQNDTPLPEGAHVDI